MGVERIFLYLDLGRVRTMTDKRYFNAFLIWKKEFSIQGLTARVEKTFFYEVLLVIDSPFPPPLLLRQHV